MYEKMAKTVISWPITSNSKVCWLCQVATTVVHFTDFKIFLRFGYSVHNNDLNGDPPADWSRAAGSPTCLRCHRNAYALRRLRLFLHVSSLVARTYCTNQRQDKTRLTPLLWLRNHSVILSAPSIHWSVRLRTSKRLVYTELCALRQRQYIPRNSRVFPRLVPSFYTIYQFSNHRYYAKE